MIDFDNEVAKDVKLINSAHGVASLIAGHFYHHNNRRVLLLRSTGKEQEGRHNVLFQINQDYPVAMIVSIGKSLPSSSQLSTPTDIAIAWRHDPFDVPMPIENSRVKARLSLPYVDANGEFAIDFFEEVLVVDDVPIDDTILKLTTDPPIDFTWNAKLQ